jgi:hypothetical protein
MVLTAPGAGFSEVESLNPPHPEEARSAVSKDGQQTECA